MFALTNRAGDNQICYNKTMRLHLLHCVNPVRSFGLSVLVLLLLTALPVGAECNPATQLCNPLQANSFGELVQSLARALVAVAIPIVVIFLIYSGFLFVSARGNEQQLEKAKKTFYWTIVGAAVVVGAYALASAIVDFARTLGGNGG